MKFVKKSLLVVLLLVALGAGIYWTQAQGYFEDSPLANISFPEAKIPEKIAETIKIPEKFTQKAPDSDKIKELTQDATNQTKELSSKAQEVGNQAQKILGESVKAGEEVPLSERVLDYGKYIYCQEVIKEYESQEK